MTNAASAYSQKPKAELEFRAVGFRVRSRTVLRDVDLSLGAGEFVALVGPNGSGKTTLLKLALGLLTPTSGAVAIAGRKTSELDARQRASTVAWLPQNIELSDPIDAAEVVAAGRFRFGEGNQLGRKAAELALGRVGAAELSARRVTELSGGERQRVLLATLLAQATPLILLDEPANHLDPRQQHELYALLGTWWKDDGLGVLCVTHDVNLLADLPDPERVRVVGLDQGRIQFSAAFAAPELPSLLSQLFNVHVRAIELDGRRVLVTSSARDSS